MYTEIDSGEVIEELPRLDDLFETWGGTDFGTAVATYDPLGSPSFQAWRAGLEDRERRAEEEAEQQRLVAAEEWGRQRGEEERQIREAPSRSPADFPEERRLNDLTRVEVASLQRWMTNVLGLTDACIERWRHHQLVPPPSVYIEINWSRAGERRSARCGFSAYPTVREAFRESFDLAWSDEGM